MWILQLRARSKAAEAGLMEGDEVLAVNGYNCKDVSYDRLMTLVEHAGHYLDLDIIRYANHYIVGLYTFINNTCICIN